MYIYEYKNSCHRKTETWGNDKRDLFCLFIFLLFDVFVSAFADYVKVLLGKDGGVRGIIIFGLLGFFLGLFLCAHEKFNF